MLKIEQLQELYRISKHLWPEDKKTFWGRVSIPGFRPQEVLFRREFGVNAKGEDVIRIIANQRHQNTIVEEKVHDRTQDSRQDDGA